MRYAILDSGGKQYIAREGETIEVDRLPLEIGNAIEFTDILLIADDGEVTVGTPNVKGASVKGRVQDQIKAAKIIVFKYIPKERYRRKQGHRQRYTRVAIESIMLKAADGKKAAAKQEPISVVTKEEPKQAPTKATKTTAPAASEKAKPTAKTAVKKPAASKSTTKKSEKKPSAKQPSSAKSTTAKEQSGKATKAPAKKTTSKSGTKTPSKKSTTDKKK